MNTKEAKAEIKKGLVVFRAFEKADELISILDAAEGSVDEANKKLQSLEKSIAELELEKSDLKAASEAAKKEAQEIVTNANLTAIGIISKAKAAAEDIEEKASKSVKEAKSSVEFEAAKLSKLQDDTARAKEEHDKIAEALEASKEKLRNMFG